MDLIIETRNISKTFGTKEISVKAVQGVNLAVKQGEFVAIVGPSGSGKSSLLHILGAMEKPTSGEVFFRGKSLSGMRDGERTGLRAKEIGFIFQTFNLLPMLSAFENVEVVMRFANIGRKQRVTRANRLLNKVGLAKRAKHQPMNLSGGERQRVAIARALANRPSLILADEPTGNLDTKTGIKILEMLRDICNKEKQTVIMVTHDFRIASYADRVLVLRDGRIFGEAKLKDLVDTHKVLGQLLDLELE